MFRRFLKIAGLLLLLLVLVGAGLYAAGLRIQLDGGGTPHLGFVVSPESQARQIERHREAQRAAGPPPAAAPAQPDPLPAAASAPGGEPGSATPAPSTESAAARDLPARTRAYWTSFRGPARDGHYREQAIRLDWPAAGLTPLWKQPVGGGYASFAVAEGRAFTIEQRGPNEVVAAYDVPTGRELWTNAWPAAFRELMGGDGPRATPTWAEGRIFALGGEGELRALDAATGAVIWRTNILDDAGAENLQWGMAASPLVVDDLVVVLPGGRSGQSVVAYDRTTGTRRWAAHDDQASYSSPMLATLAGVRQIVVFSASRLMGLVPETGALLWEHPWKTQFEIHASQPVVIGDNRIFLSSGYGVGAAVLELTPSGAGLAVREVWRNIRMKNQFTSSVLLDGHIYGLDEAILACVDAGTGELKWKGGRYGYGQVVLASGHLIVTAEDGSIALVRATPERHVEITRFPVFDGRTWNHPALAGGYLLVRNAHDMAAFDLR